MIPVFTAISADNCCLLSGLGFTQQEFGYSGLLLALGVAAGSVINRVLLKRGWHSPLK